VVENLEYYRIHYTDYRSDYRPIATSYNRQLPEESQRKRKRLYKDAD
jgi:hypothetical protein